MSERPPVDHDEFASGRGSPAYENSQVDPDSRSHADIDEQISVLDLLIVLARHKALLIGLSLAAGIFAAVNVLLQPNVYTATATLLPPGQTQASSAQALLSQIGNLAGVAVQGGGRGTADVYIAMLKSRTVADSMIQRFDLMNAWKAERAGEARGRLQGATKVTLLKDGLITIEFTDEDPKRAAEFANAYVDELLKLTQVIAVTEASQRRLFFERQLANAKNNLAKAEVAARRALGQRGLVNVDEQGRTMIETTARLRGQITVKEVQLGAMRAFATESNPDVHMTQRELESLKRELAKMEGDAVAGDAPGKAGRPTQGMESVHLLRDVKYHEVVFELLARQYEVAKIDEAKESSVVQVLDEAVPPESRSGPKRTVTVLVWTFAAGIIGLVLAFGLEALAKTRRNPQQTARLRELRRSLRWRHD